MALALVLAGCGGAAGEDAAPTTGKGADERSSELAREFADEGWKTDFSRREVSLTEFQSGGPPRDGIPPIDEPKFVAIAVADDDIADREPVILVEHRGEARAYPINILIWHEIVNDEIGGTPVAVTFCPLCNTSIVFDRRVGGETLDFGTTGKLRNSDLVMWDRQTQSWWQQFGGEGLVGRYAGERLEQLPARILGWGEVKRTFPEARVLSRDTGHDRSYGQNPYEGYDDVDTPPFFGAANADDDRLPPKERVVYIERGEDAVVVPFPVLQRERELEVEVGGEQLVVRWRKGVASALDSGDIEHGRDVGAAEVLSDGKLVPFDEPFWFAVAAFQPDARIVR
ncbi:MAG TPA: DUF3179 domain-containing protein [Gaiellaceae bacterium]|nr:DUF3179 domain-containing protein [Gaiellaceae bacterium]